MTALRAIRYYRVAPGLDEVRVYGRYVGHVRKRGRGWWAELPGRGFFPSPFGTRRTAAERLRQSHEAQVRDR